ncbi:hypothetical protein RI054_05g26850 [Pseudoscourfieldia marina]
MADVEAQNFKGVMLCDRPTDAGSGRTLDSASLPFVAGHKTGANDQLGLTPVPSSNRVDADGARVSRGGTQGALSSAHSIFDRYNAMVRHKKFLKLLSRKVRTMRESKAAKEVEKVEKKENIMAFCTTLRSAVLDGKDVSTFWKPSQAAAKLRETQSAQLADSSAAVDENAAAHGATAPDVAPLALDVDALVADAVAARQAVLAEKERKEREPPPVEEDAKEVVEEVEVPPPADANEAAKKPAWARTGEEAEAVEATEESELLAFAEGLDPESLDEEFASEELKDALVAMDRAKKTHEEEQWNRELVRAMNALANADAKAAAAARAAHGEGVPLPSNVDELTEAAKARIDEVAAERAARESAADERLAGAPAWDASTTVGGDEERETMAEGRRAAEEFLAENKEFKAVHSVSSAKAMLESGAAKQQEMAAA